MRRNACVLALLVLGTACANDWTNIEPVAPSRRDRRSIGDIAPAHLASLDARHRFGDGIAFQNLTVWPVISTAESEVGRFMTLMEAAELGAVSIREAPSASVSSIEIENHSSVPVLVCAGTMVKGGRQDRQIANDTVILPGERAMVRAFCVEKRRWHDERGGVKTAGVFKTSDWMAAKRVRVAGQYDRDQRSVWKQTHSLTNVVFRKLKEQKPGYASGLSGSQYYLASTRPKTGTLFNAQEHEDDETLLTRRQMASVVKGHFADTGRRLVGFGYAIDGEPVSVRTFASRDLLLDHLDVFVNTMIFEAEIAQRCDRRGGRAIHTRPGSIEAMLAMVKGIQGARLSPVVSSSNQRLQQRTNGFGGNSVCKVRMEDGRWVELTQDWTATVEYGKEALTVLGKMQALGYTR